MKIRSLIREHIRKILSEEAKSDQEIINIILDKVSKFGEGSLTDIEKRFFDHISKGEEIPSPLKKTLQDKKSFYNALSKIDDPNEFIISSIKKGTPIHHDVVKLASQETIDKYIKIAGDKGIELYGPTMEMASSPDVISEYISSMTKEQRKIGPDVLEMAPSKDIVEKYITSIAESNVYISPTTLKELLEQGLISKDTVDEFVKTRSKPIVSGTKVLGSTLEPSILKLASQEAINEFINNKAENGSRVRTDNLSLASQGTIDKYILSMHEKGKTIERDRIELASPKVKERVEQE